MKGLELTQEDFEDIHAALDSTRETTAYVKVPREAFATLLRDHSRMIAELGWLSPHRKKEKPVTMEDLL